MRILVTGGSGFIGSNLAEPLARAYEVLARPSTERDLLKERDNAHRYGAVANTRHFEGSF